MQWRNSSTETVSDKLLSGIVWMCITDSIITTRFKTEMHWLSMAWEWRMSKITRQQLKETLTNEHHSAQTFTWERSPSHIEPKLLSLWQRCVPKVKYIKKSWTGWLDIENLDDREDRIQRVEGGYKNKQTTLIGLSSLLFQNSTYFKTWWLFIPPNYIFIPMKTKCITSQFVSVK